LCGNVAAAKIGDAGSVSGRVSENDENIGYMGYMERWAQGLWDL